MLKIVLALLLSSSCVYAQNMQPGLWSAKSVLALNGLQLPASEGEECITKEDAKDVKETITKELKKKGCELTKWNLKNKKLEAALKCQNNDLEAEGTIKGTVTDKSYNLKGEAEGTFKMIPSSATIELTGKWVKACTKK